MGQLSENMKSLALEDDKYFITRSRGILHALDKRLIKYAEVVLDELEQPIDINQTPVLYIPISHHHIFDESQENKIEKDISDILNLKYEGGDLIAIGETLSGNYTIENRKNQITDTMKRLSGLGVVPKQMVAEQYKLIDHQNGFERAILFFVKEKETVVKGVESLEGAIIATALESKLAFTHDDEDGVFKNEIKYRIGIEARTRLALQRANQLADKSKQIIFFQGAFHLEGVKGWCERHSINLQTIVPNAIKSKFKGRDSTLEFSE